MLTNFWHKHLRTVGKHIITYMEHVWLVVSTPLKNISPLGWVFPIYGKKQNMLQSPPTSNITYMEHIDRATPTLHFLQWYPLKPPGSIPGHKVEANALVKRNHQWEISFLGRSWIYYDYIDKFTITWLYYGFTLLAISIISIDIIHNIKDLL